MSYQLGVDLGTTYTAAAVRRGDEVRIIHLGTRSAAIPSVVLLKEDETILVGEAAQRRGASEPGRVAREFKRRIGDTTPLILGTTPYSAEALMARLLRWVVEEVTRREGGPPSSVAVTHPANWGEYKKGLLNQAIRLADIEHATLITEPEAAALHYASQERVEPGKVIAVYDLGGGTFDAALLRKVDDGFAYLGAPEGIERLGGIDFDEAVFNHASRALEAAGAVIDPTDPQTVAALRRLRDECTEAKEALSLDSDVSIAVMMPSVQTEVRLTRAELEAMIRPSLADTIGAMQRAVRGADLEMQDVDAILLVGGSSRIPLVGELVAGELGRPVVVDTHPKHAIALGAALWDPGAADAVAQAASLPAPGPTPLAAPAEPATPAAPPVAPTPEPAAPAAPPVAPTPEPAAPAAPPVAPTPEPAAPAAPHFAPTPAAPSGPPIAAAFEPTAASPAVTAPIPVAVGGSLPGGSTDSRKGLLIGGIVLVAAVIVAIAVFALPGGEDSVTTVDAPTVEAAAPVFEPAVTTVAEPTTAPSPVPTQAPTPLPTATPPPTATPLPFPPETRRTNLTGITLAGPVYEVAYETVNFEPLIGGAGTFHMHFHWNVYPPDTVGNNAAVQNPWTIWDLRGDGAKVFDQFGPGNAPGGATGICVVVATNTHAIDQIELAQDTVSCIDLP